MHIMSSRRAFLNSIVMLLGFATTANSAVLTGPLNNPANGHDYYLLVGSRWTEAQFEATALGGNLATINNAAEQQWIFENFSTFGGVDRNLWIGLNDVLIDGNFVWVSGESSSFANWATFEPNNSGDENFVHLWQPNAPLQVGSDRSAGKWNDVRNFGAIDPSGAVFGPFNGVVEIAVPVTVPEPSTFLMFVLGALATATLRRHKVDKFQTKLSHCM